MLCTCQLTTRLDHYFPIVLWAAVVERIHLQLLQLARDKKLSRRTRVAREREEEDEKRQSH